MRNPVKLLIVDDKPANLLALEAVLAGPEYTLVRADSGYEALERVKEDDFAAILLDIQMPGIDGYETARRIKAMPAGRDVPIMFITAFYKEDEDVRRGYAAGALDFFAKPLVPELLRTKVQIYADLYRMTRQAREHETLIAALKERAAAEKALDAVLESVSEGVVITDAAGNVTRTNREAQRILGGAEPRPITTLDGLVGWWVDTGEKLRRDQWALARTLASGGMFMNEPIWIRCLDGSESAVIESASPLTDEAGVLVGAVLVFKPLPVAPPFAPGRERPRPEAPGPH